MIKYNSFINGNCFELLNQIEDESVDLILTDPPYGTTSLKYDCKIDVSKLFELFRQKLKPYGTIICFSKEPLSSEIIYSQKDLFKYRMIWVKPKKYGFYHCHNMPLSQFEEILVLSKGKISHKGNQRMTYNPQSLSDCAIQKNNNHNKHTNFGTSRKMMNEYYIQNKTGYPSDVLYFDKETNYLHPSQKPQKLLEYLILTFSNLGQLIVDPFSGVASTCLAAKTCGRQFIGFELDCDYYQKGSERLREGFINPLDKGLDCLKGSTLETRQTPVRGVKGTPYEGRGELI